MLLIWADWIWSTIFHSFTVFPDQLVLSCASAKAEHDLSNLSCVVFYVDLFLGTPSPPEMEFLDFKDGFGISTKIYTRMVSFFSKATQPIRMHLTAKMLPPFGKEGHSPNENAGFPVITNTTCNRSNDNTEFPDTTKLHAKQGGHTGFPDTTKNTYYRSTTQC